jgi:hypothetical protein
MIDNRFVMFSTAVSGGTSNNFKFSACSIASMKSDIETRAAVCFVAQPNSTCGDSVVDAGEDCDAGVYGGDACCSATCTFRAGVVCSDRELQPWRSIFIGLLIRVAISGNSRCCRNCDLAGVSLTETAKMV